MNESPPFPPAPPPTSETPAPPPIDAPPPGYHSQKSKKRFITIACALVGVFFIAQFVAPWLVKKLLTPYGILGGVQVTAHQVNNSACWDERIWYAQTAASLDEKVKTKLMSLALGGQQEAVEAASLEMVEPWLVAGADRLWIVSPESVACYKDGQVRVITPKDRLGETSRPFLYGGKPAVIEKDWPGHCLKVFDEDQWQEKASFKLGIRGGMELSGESLQAFESAGQLHLFCRPQGAMIVSHRQGLPGEEDEEADAWEPIVEAPGQWKAASLAGRPAVFYHDSPGGEGPYVIGVSRSGRQWKEFFTYPVGLDIGLGICPTGTGEDFVLLRRILPIGTEVIGIKDGQPDWRFEQKGGVGLLVKTRLLLNVPILVGPVLAGLLAVVLSLLMSRYKIGTCTAGEGFVKFASPVRRGLAVVIDAVLMVGPFVVFAVLKVQEFLSEPLSVSGFFAIILKVGCVGLLWLPLIFLIFNLIEGSWGWTPGKLIAGVRVVGTDLRRCGFGRALLRNLLRIVDFFGWYTVGLTAAALTEKWQRIGDLAAKTIVIRTPKEKATGVQR